MKNDKKRIDVVDVGNFAIVSVIVLFVLFIWSLKNQEGDAE